MERKLGTLSYNPKNLVPMYNGSGPNCFWDFMQSKIRQNIVEACYNDSLTQEQISLETGIPLPYLDSEILALAEKEILLKEGSHYKANVIIITSECADEIIRDSVSYHEKIADLLAEFLETNLPAFRQIGFCGADFSDNTLRWQLMTFLLRAGVLSGARETTEIPPLTAWGDRAWLYLAEQGNALSKSSFNYCTVGSRQDDLLQFIDYLPDQKGDHHDFYGNDHLINILCDIARGRYDHFSEYDLEAVAELIRKGYVLKEKDAYTVSMPVFTSAQHTSVCQLVNDFALDKLENMLEELDQVCAKVLKEHTPRHLQGQVSGISSAGRFVNGGCIPLDILVKRKVLHTNWNPMEMPTIQIRLNR